MHDTLLAACDRERYELLGATEPHDNCTDNLHAALATVDLVVPATPSPLNLFENARPAADGTIAIAPPVSTPGSSVTFRVELDALLVLSACPQDMVATNGPGLTPDRRALPHNRGVLRVLIAGVTGWTGAPLARAVEAADDLEFAGGIARSGADFTSVAEALAAVRADVVVDYTSAAVVRANVDAALAGGATSSSAPPGCPSRTTPSSTRPRAPPAAA